MESIANYFISDTHFGHKNVMSFDNRPFNSVEENDKTLIENWNSVVSEFDDIWFLGDLSWHNATKTLKILRQLNGVKHWIVGNHDYKLLRNRDIKAEFIEITHYKEIDVDGYRVVLCHYPIVSYNGRYNHAIHLYGHVHTTQDENDIQECNRKMRGSNAMYNVGCMMPRMEYSPKRLEEIINWEKVDNE